MIKTRLRILLALFAMLPLLAGAAETDFGLLLREFNSQQGQQRITTGNKLMGMLKAQDYFDEDISFSTKTPIDTMKQQVWYWAAEYFYEEQHYNDAVTYALKALPLCQVGNDRTIEADCLSLLAISHIRLAEYQNAAKYAKQCYELDRKSGDYDRMSSSLNTLTSIYVGARQPKVAEEYALKAIETAKKVNNPQRMAVLLGKASEVYHMLDNDTKALDYAKQAYQLEVRLGKSDRIGIRLSQMASAYIGLKRPQAAKDTLQQAIPLLKASGNDQQLGICCNQMGALLLGSKAYDEAATYYDEAREIFSRLGDRYNESIALRGLYKSLSDSDPATAMKHLERYNELKDSLYDRETGMLLSEYAARFGNEQLEEANKSARNDFWTLLLISIAIVIIMAILGILLYRQMQKRSKKQASLTSALQESMIKLQQDYSDLHQHYENAMTTNTNEGEELSEADKQFLSRLLTIVNAQIDEGNVNVDNIAAELCMSTSQFRRRLITLTNVTPQVYIINIRMQKARHLLDNSPEMNIAEIALRCGYDEKANFTRAFKKFYGMTPSDYLKKQKLTTI